MTRQLALKHGALIAGSIALCFQAQLNFAQQSDKAPTNVVTIAPKDATRMAWETFELPQLKASIFIKLLESDKETGMTALLVRYPAGFINTWHTHPTAHGMYVLDGVLKTHQGEYGPGLGCGSPRGAGWSMGPQRRMKLQSCSSPTRSSISSTQSTRTLGIRCTSK